MRTIKLKVGDIFCIPLFMPKDDWKLLNKLKKEDYDKDFAFGRIIEFTSDITIEIFNRIGPATLSIDEIIGSGVLVAPIKIFGDAIIKKRWNVIGATESYDRFRDSNYNQLKMVYGVPGEFRVRQLASGEERLISREEMELLNIPYATVWYPINLENRIIKLITENKR